MLSALNDEVDGFALHHLDSSDGSIDSCSFCRPRTSGALFSEYACEDTIPIIGAMT